MSIPSTEQNRLDPSLFDAEELERLMSVLLQRGLPVLSDGKGNEIELPAPIYQHLVRILQMMRERRAIVLLPEDETFTTQAAADFLGMSRQFLVNLLEQNQIPFHRVGAHRRVYFKDLLDYQKQRDADRHARLNALAGMVDKAGLYFPGKDKPERGNNDAD